MSLKDYEPRITKSALHRREEHVKQVFRDQVAEAAGLLEVVLSAIVLVALLLSVVPLLQFLPGLLTHGNSAVSYTQLDVYKRQDLHIVQNGTEGSVAAVVGPVGVDQADLGDGGVAVLGLEVVLAELDVGVVHGQAPVSYTHL